MTKKALVLVITVWIASNFGCTGLQTPNLDIDDIIDSCKVTFLTGSVDIGPREKGVVSMNELSHFSLALGLNKPWQQIKLSNWGRTGLNN